MLFFNLIKTKIMNNIKKIKITMNLKVDIFQGQFLKYNNNTEKYLLSCVRQ